MAQITVTINGKSFRMACDDGEEDRLMGLASRFDGWIGELKTAFGEIGDQRLTVMAGIMATDQLSEMERKMQRLESELAEARRQQDVVRSSMSQHEQDLSRAVNTAAARIESLADGLSKSLRGPSD